jgi:hypothetical protein
LSNEENTGPEKNQAIRARQRAIGRELRRIYDNVAQEPVPDDFLDLLKKIDEMDVSPAARKAT